jgi:DNA repair exonuclease SbcCD ATPase subunit
LQQLEALKLRRQTMQINDHTTHAVEGLKTFVTPAVDVAQGRIPERGDGMSDADRLRQLRLSKRIVDNEIGALKEHEAVRIASAVASVGGEREAARAAQVAAKVALTEAKKKAKEEAKKAKEEAKKAKDDQKKTLAEAKKKAKEDQKQALAEAKKKAKDDQKALAEAKDDRKALAEAKDDRKALAEAKDDRKALAEAKKKAKETSRQASSSSSAPAAPRSSALQASALQAFVDAVRKASNEKDTKRMQRFNDGYMSDPEDADVEFMLDDVTCSWELPLDDVKCCSIKPACRGRYLVEAVSAGGHKFYLKCLGETLCDWASAQKWLEERPGLLSSIPRK